MARPKDAPNSSSPLSISRPSNCSSPPNGSSPSEGSSPPNVSRPADDCSIESTKVEKMARGKFQVATLATGRDTLTLEEGRHELNCLLSDSAGFEPVSEDEFVDLFFDLADLEAEEISEDLFSKMFEEIYKKQQKGNSLNKVMREHVERFRNRAKPRNCLHLKLAARLISNFRKEDHARRKLPFDSSDLDVVSHELHKFDADQNGNFSEDEFMVAVKKLVYDVEIK